MHSSLEIPLLKPVGFQKYKRALFLICFFSSMFGGTVSTLMSVYLPDAMKDLLQDGANQKADNISATINSIFIFGWTAGGIIWGVFCDTLGRKKSFIYATACYGLFTILTGLAPTWFLVVACRFFSGFGIGGVLVITTMLISEGYQEKKRVVLLGILSISIPVGIFSAGLLTYFVSHWRYAYSWRHTGALGRYGCHLFHRI
jgi:MFS family permease